MSKFDVDTNELEYKLASFVRAFGLHQSEQTPCGVKVSVSEAHTLIELERSGGLTQTELVSFLKLEKSSVSRLTASLSKRDWIQQDQHPKDARAYLLTLTVEGSKKAKQIMKSRTEKFARLTQALPDNQRQSVLTALTTLVEAINEAEHND